MRTVIGGLVIVILLLGGAALLPNLLADDEPALTNPLPRATAFPEEEPFWGKVKKFSVVGARVLEVKVRLLNTGNQEDVGECDIVAYDENAAISSAPVTTGTPATPGYGVIVTRMMRISQGAETVKRVEVAC